MLAKLILGSNYYLNFGVKASVMINSLLTQRSERCETCKVVKIRKGSDPTKCQHKIGLPRIFRILHSPNHVTNNISRLFQKKAKSFNDASENK